MLGVSQRRRRTSRRSSCASNFGQSARTMFSPVEGVSRNSSVSRSRCLSCQGRRARSMPSRKAEKVVERAAPLVVGPADRRLGQIAMTVPARVIAFAVKRQVLRLGETGSVQAMRGAERLVASQGSSLRRSNTRRRNRPARAGARDESAAAAATRWWRYCGQAFGRLGTVR